MKTEAFDIIIAGAGPAGLSIAAELAAHHSVLIIEQKRPGTTAASWYSYRDRAEEHGLTDCVAFESDHLHFVAPSFQHNMQDDCVVLDHNRVLEQWLSAAKANGAVVHQTSFRDFRYCDEGVLVETSDGTFRAALLIDAMGAPSAIAEKHKLVKRKDAWVIYGARIEIPQNDRPTQIEYYPLNDEANTYVGVHPYNDQETNFYIFNGQSGTYGKPHELKEQFERVLKQHHPDARVLQQLCGTIPSGILKHYSLDRVIFWGAAGMLNPDGCGMGFNEILQQRKTFTAGILRVMAEKKLDRKSLHGVARSIRNIETMHFQRIIGAFSLYFIKSDGKWDGGVRWLNAMGAESRYWMRNEMSMEWIRTATIRLHQAVPLRESVKMIPVNELFFIVEQLIRFSLSNIFSNLKGLFRRKS
ncbi:MAG: NAD(P)-binding protein [bacterium]|nr:NAD(P)-binding protein [bacterium]